MADKKVAEESQESQESSEPDGLIHKKIRDIGHVKAYLEHFIPPDISLSTLISCFVVAPFSILLNIYFIVYNFIILIINGNDDSDNIRYLRIGNKIIVCVEFAGLSLLFMVIIGSYIFKYKCIVIDCIKECGSWSTFKLFYNFRPKSLINYYSTCFSHHTSRLNQTNIGKYKKCKRLKFKLTKEIEEINDNDNDDDMRNAMITTINKLNEIINHFEKSSDFNELYKENICSRMIRVLSWFSFIFISLILLLFGMMSLTMKLAQFSYINKEDILEWKYSEYFLFIAFCNQLWNMCDIDNIRKDTIYRFIFMDQNGKFTRFIANKIATFDSIIKHQLINSFGIKGLFLSISMDSKFLHKLIVQDSFDNFGVDQLLIYKNKKEDDHIMDEYDLKTVTEKIKIHKNKNDITKPLLDAIALQPQNTKSTTKTVNESTASKEIEVKTGKLGEMKANFLNKTEVIQNKLKSVLDKFKMNDYQQPLHPYISAESLITRYQQKTGYNEKQILYGKTHKDIEYNSYSFDKKQKYHFKVEIKTNLFMNIAVIFEKLEWFIKFFSPTIIFIAYLTTFVTAILSIHYQSNDWTLTSYYEYHTEPTTTYHIEQTCVGKPYLQYAQQFVNCGIVIFSCLFVAILLIGLVIYKEIDHKMHGQILQFIALICFNAAGLTFVYDFVKQCMLLSCFNNNDNYDSITNITKYGVSPNYYYIFLISNAVFLYCLFLIPLIFAIAYPVPFVLLVYFFIVYTASYALMIYIPILFANELNYIYQLTFDQDDCNCDVLLILSVILGFLIISSIIFSIIHYCCTAKYRIINKNITTELTKKWDIAYFVSQITIYIVHVVYIIIYYAIYNDEWSLEVDIITILSWAFVIPYTIILLYIFSKQRNYLNYMYQFNWIQVWITAFSRLCSVCCKKNKK